MLVWYGCWFGTDFGLVRMLVLVWYGFWFGTDVGLVRMLVWYVCWFGTDVGVCVGGQRGNPTVQLGDHITHADAGYHQ